MIDQTDIIDAGVYVANGKFTFGQHRCKRSQIFEVDMTNSYRASHQSQSCEANSKSSKKAPNGLLG